MGDTTQTLGNLKFTWKQLAAQDWYHRGSKCSLFCFQSVLESRGHQWLHRKPRRDCETHCILQHYTHSPAIIPNPEKSRWHKKKKDSFLCFQGLLVSHILLPLPGPAFGGLLSILGTSLTVSMVTEFNHAHSQPPALQRNQEWRQGLKLGSKGRL